MRSLIVAAVLLTIGAASLVAADVGKKRELPFFCLGKKEDFFSCASNKECVNKKAVCDGRTDCQDASDEAGCKCTRRRDCPRGHKCIKNLDLATSECVACPEGKQFSTDHQQCEDINECLQTPNVCAGRGSCVNYEGGYACVHCPKGYEGHMHNWRDFLTANRGWDGNADDAVNNSDSNDSNNDITNDEDKGADQSARIDALRTLFLCNDEDECANEDPCRADSFSHDRYCVNTIGNYTCHCPPNHAPKDADAAEFLDDFVDNVCRAIGEVPQIAIAENTSIALYDLRSNELLAEISFDEPLVDIAAFKGIVFYAHTRQIYEYRVALNATSLVIDLELDNDFGSEIKKMAVDWVNRRIYFLTGDAISVANFFGESAKIIEHRGNISSIAVDPVARYLFYSEQGSVRRAYLDGRPTRHDSIFQALNTLTDGQSFGQEALTLDPNLGSIYYVFDRILYSFDYSGHHAVVLSTSAQFAYLEPFEDRLYAAYRSDAKGVVSVPRVGYTIGRREGRASIVTFSDSRPRAISVLHAVKHPAGPRNVSCPQSGASVRTCAPQDWCFPLPANREPSFRCACSRLERKEPSERKDCVAINIRLLRPQGLIESSSYSGDGEGRPNSSGALQAGRFLSIQTFLSSFAIFLSYRLMPAVF